MTATDQPIGIIGRHPALLDRASEIATGMGFRVLGTIDDAVALGWLRSQEIRALVIGGGVELESRRTLREAALAVDVVPLEVFGPDHIRDALATL